MRRRKQSHRSWTTSDGDRRPTSPLPTPPAWETGDHPYSGKTVVLATKHHKLPLIGPPLTDAVGLRVDAVEVDTDVFGTFTGDVPRTGRPLDTAIAKARMGMQIADQPLGLASEGSISPDPAMPFVIADHETVVLVDDEHQIVIAEHHASWDVIAASTTVAHPDDLGPFLATADFPRHHLIVRPNSGQRRPIYKGISEMSALTTAISVCAQAATDRLALVETDLRAHACPSRRAVIATAAKRLARRVAARCPRCGAPGWGQIDVLLGVPCSHCDTPVDRPRAAIDGCAACDHRDTRLLVSPDARADPSECPYCNP